MTTTSGNSIRKIGAGVALIGAPVMLLTADIVIQTTEVYRWDAITKIAIALFVAAMFALMRMTRGRAEGMALIGVSLGIIGLLNVSMITTVNTIYAEVSQAGLDAAVTERITGILRGVFQKAIMFPLPGPAFPLGMALLGIALFRAKAVHVWFAACIVIGAVLFPIGRIGGIPWAILSGDAAWVLSISVLGVRLLRGSGLPALRESPGPLFGVPATNQGTR